MGGPAREFLVISDGKGEVIEAGRAMVEPPARAVVRLAQADDEERVRIEQQHPLEPASCALSRRSTVHPKTR